MRRLYVGGLSHTVTQKDLKDRFGKFGDVEEVELRTRRDDEGVPYKTFGYINIEISDADLKKCMTVLNKSKWKGGTLQIETAKESFLHRLAEERQEAEEQRQQPREVEDKRQKMLDSLSKAGVENFTMKAAVPGTEIPGHKDWVVSKFGRVLPVLQLRCHKGSKTRTQKYDPSKYSHNIRRLDKTAEDPSTPVTQLTWEIQGGDDDISKKRRGEFPPFEPSRPKKSRTDTVNSQSAMGRTRLKPAVDSNNHNGAHQCTNGYEPTTNLRPAQRREVYIPDSDADSDEEIRRMVAAQSYSHVALGQEEEEDNLEVVGLDYLAKTGRSHQLQRDDKDENDYDSADTDELLASKKPPPTQETPPSENHITITNTDKKAKTKKKTKKAEKSEEEEVSSDDEDNIKSRKLQTKSTQQKKSSQSQNKKLTVMPVVESSQSESDSDEEEEEEEEEESANDSDSDYEAMFSNVMHLEISLADLQRIAEESEQTSETTAPSILSSSSKQGTTPKSAPKKGTTPEEILASIMAEDSSDDEQKKKKKKKRKAVVSTPLPAFQGTRAMSEGSETEAEIKKQKLDFEAAQVTIQETEKKTLDSEEVEEEESEEEEEEEEEEKKEMIENKATHGVVKALGKIEKTETHSSSSDDDDDEEEEEEEEEAKSGPTVPPKAAAKASPSSSSSSSEEDEDEQEIISAAKAAPAHQNESSSSSSSSEEEEEEEEKPAPPHRVPLGAKEEEERQREANIRRLAALQQRQKETEEHKKLIQGALANLDGPAKGGGGKHIVFGSDDDDDDDEIKKQATSEITMSKKTLFKNSQSENETTDDEEAGANKKVAIKEKVHLKPSVSHLFSGSEDEEEGDEEDSSRFDIRPQFEGEAGQKLMELQSRFGADERFRMDSRFLEEEKDKEEDSEIKKSVTEDDEALEEERKKNLSILQSVLGSSQQTSSSKTASKAKTFRDVSALHYDPSKEEHAAFETKTEETKESKAARKKKREEAQKLPEVSKEIYFDVSGDLKAVFGASKPEVTEKEEKQNWDQEEDEEEEEKKDEQLTLLSSLHSADGSAEKEESSGFKFSFFGDDAETESKQTEEYKVESIQGPKVSWQQDPRFHDSSSEEDEDEQEEDEEKTNIVAKPTEEETPLIYDRFFFFPEDSRLTEGPRLFCRPSHLEEQREQWEETRTALRQEYRKKHKDARRKLKSSQRS